ncbi:phospholipase D domain protein, partial [Ostertagia ostertagi]
KLKEPRQVTTIAIGNVDEGESSDLDKSAGDGQVVYADADTGGVLVTVSRKGTRSVSADSPRKTPTPEPSVLSPPTSQPSAASRLAAVSGKKPTFLSVVEDAKGKKIINYLEHFKHVRRAASAAARTRAPLDMLEKAGPPPSVLDKATKMGLDFSTAVEKYKEYVESGAVQKEKHRSQTPPLKRKESRFSKAVDNWKSNRARKKWKQVLDSDEVTAGYELDFLRLKQMDSEDKDSIDGGVKLWMGKDYVNYIHKDFIEVDLPFHGTILWLLLKTWKSKSIIESTSVKCGTCKKKKDDANIPYLLPKSYENLKVPRVFKNPAFSYNVDIQYLEFSFLCCISELIWFSNFETLSLQHFIYIENQFFVSMIDSNDVLNEICKVICNRVIRAYKEKQPFRVYIMIPLLPGFEGNVGAPGGSSLQAVLHWTYLSLSRGPNSLFERLKAVVPNPHDYISVCSLRGNDILCGKLVSELIYVHCKLLIVDDEHVIIGSANINDRSQVTFPSFCWCAVVFSGHPKLSINNERERPYAAGKFAKSLRVQCMQEHLGLLPDSRSPSHFKYDVCLDDPVAESFFVDVWQSTARSNMLIYEEVFRTYPTDNVETFEEFEKWTGQMPLAEYSPQQAQEKAEGREWCPGGIPFEFLMQSESYAGNHFKGRPCTKCCIHVKLFAPCRHNCSRTSMYLLSMCK